MSGSDSPPSLSRTEPSKHARAAPHWEAGGTTTFSLGSSSYRQEFAPPPALPKSADVKAARGHELLGTGTGPAPEKWSAKNDSGVDPNTYCRRQSDAHLLRFAAPQKGLKDHVNWSQAHATCENSWGVLLASVSGYTSDRSVSLDSRRRCTMRVSVDSPSPQGAPPLGWVSITPVALRGLICLRCTLHVVQGPLPHTDGTVQQDGIGRSFTGYFDGFVKSAAGHSASDTRHMSSNCFLVPWVRLLLRYTEAEPLRLLTSSRASSMPIPRGRSRGVRILTQLAGSERGKLPPNNGVRDLLEEPGIRGERVVRRFLHEPCNSQLYLKPFELKPSCIQNRFVAVLFDRDLDGVFEAVNGRVKVIVREEVL